MSSATCVQRETLKQYLVGGIDDQLSAEIESHLSQCKDCEQTVVELESHPDTLIISVRNLAGAHALATEADETPSVVERAVNAARRLPGTSSQSTATLLPLQQIGAYELLRPLGRGGMGMVVLARHRSLHKEVAIKLLSSLVGDKPELVHRFQREMRAAGQLQHPAIVNATDAGQEHGTHYLVMEYVAGLDLSRIARLTGPLGIADACELMRQTALGLSHAHAEGIVHRDVKPSNLMLDATGHVKILDFGLAQMNLWEEPVCELTTVGQLMGTIDYMAPEQAERTGAVDYRADLYALGATLFRLLAGRAPLAAAPNMTLLEKVRLLGSQTSPLLSSLREDCPPALVQLVSQLLSRDPAARPASAAHVAEALQPFCDGSQLVELLVQAQSADATDPVVEPGAAPEFHQPKLQFSDFKGSGKPPRHRWAWIAAAVFPLLIVAGFLITIETNKGQLVIQSDVADVQVRVTRDGKVVDELTIHPGAQATRLRADKYEILIDTASDQVAIDRQQFSIKSGETVVATIRRVERAVNAVRVGSASPAINSDQVTYNEIPYADWLNVLSTDVSPEKLYEAFTAIIAIGEKQSIADARPVIVSNLKSFSKSGAKESNVRSALHALWISFDKDDKKYGEFLAQLLKTGTEAEQQLLLSKIGSYPTIEWSTDPSIVQQAINVVMDPSSTKQLAEDAGSYLCNVWLRITPKGVFPVGQELSGIQRPIFDALSQSPHITASFWSRWSWEPRLQLSHFIEQPAALDVGMPQVASDKMLRYAQKIMERYDKNGDEALSPSESTGMLIDPSAADVDNDGYITVPEYAKWMEARSTSAAPPTMSPSAKTESVAKTIPSEPFYDGRTLPQWLEILERDRDTDARMSALKAIGELTPKAEAVQVTERLMAIARQANVDEWSDVALAVDAVKFGGLQSKSTLDASLISLLISLNGIEWFQSFLINELLNGDDVWTARWLAALLKNSTSWREAGVGATLFERYRDQKAFDTLGANSVWLVEAWMIQHLSSNETIAKENVHHVIELLENHAQLGEMVALQIDAEMASRFNGGNNHRIDQATRIVEEAVAKYSKTVFEDDDSSAEAVARAASRLASTTEIVDDWRTELLETVRKRLSNLAADQKRLTTMLPIEAKSNRFWTQLQTFNRLPIPFANRFAVDPPGTQLSNASSQYLARIRAHGVPPYIESEGIAIIALVIRLDAAPELDKELAAIATAAFPNFERLMIQTATPSLNVAASYWPYRLDKAGDSWSNISSATWLGWAINRTLFEFFDKSEKPLPLLSLAIRRVNLLQSFVQRDCDHDGKLSPEEFPHPERSPSENDQDGTLDFDGYEKLL